MFGQGKLKLEHENHKFVIFQLIKGHNSRAIKGIKPNFKLDLCIVIKNMVNKIQNIWSRDTKAQAQELQFCHFQLRGITLKSFRE
jgi:hypothetical protein